MDELKFCRGCSQDLPKSAFGKRSDRPCGLKSRCRECMNADLREKYQDPEFAAKDRARYSKWARDNPEKHLAKTKRWAKQNPEKVAKQVKHWYEGNKERVRKIQRKYESSRYHKDLNYKLRKLLRSRICEILRRRKAGGKKAGSAVRDLGCTIESRFY